MKNTLLLTIPIFIILSCSKITRKECQVTDNYKIINCPNSFENINDIITSIRYNLTLDTCIYHFNSSGCGAIINSIDDFNLAFKPYPTNPKIADDSSFWDFNTRTIIAFSSTTDQGDKVYSIAYVCKNTETKEIAVKCQYEVNNQCAGSEITNLELSYLISIPKVDSNYTFSFSVENSNPLW